ncbi:hypothetical protein OU995_05830 [Roseateles sp. SL47]|uniref:type IV pilus assembly protein FimV n=1 Tax=Roseateles sp. SL47 TaxID=2995138 RepID=UPI002270B922|nr:hypothetical protein [Roseateles sp. SL47]WAC74244.1 hypothetical protein OU995_05830 [Roseateles sp. SL47]
MKEQRIYAGTMTVVLDGPALHRLSASEEMRIASEFVEVVRQKAAEYTQKRNLPLGLDFEVVSTRAGCVSVRLKVFITVVTTIGGAIAGLVSLASVWPELRQALPYIFMDAGNAYHCFIDKSETHCEILRVTFTQVTKELYEVKQGDTLTKIVRDVWKVEPKLLNQVMRAVVKQNPSAFVNGDMNVLKAGSKLVKPTDEMLRGVSGGKG